MHTIHIKLMYVNVIATKCSSYSVCVCVCVCVCVRVCVLSMCICLRVCVCVHTSHMQMVVHVNTHGVQPLSLCCRVIAKDYQWLCLLPTPAWTSYGLLLCGVM